MTSFRECLDVIIVVFVSERKTNMKSVRMLTGECLTGTMKHPGSFATRTSRRDEFS